MIVLDTNIVLDLLVFQDPATQPLQQVLHSGALQWLATAPMRDELQRVLGYRQIVPRLAYYQRSAEEVLAQFDRLVQIRQAAPKAGVTCADPDDQKFIDLAMAHRATLLSKDRAVLCMAKRLESLGVRVCDAMSFGA
ncbi:putative toxin-antitoxin system toxin component, PIN family [Rhodoferax sp.]|uniref:putative toxin-antitoxin system toxin component, PIN family n=1 Tax=Rhodoferax sp. TaxID=50421 RepID=UPI00277A69EB|nr:putative toxin-antitoxin system toxin component, PIN family [Rhodoferax sp.]